MTGIELTTRASRSENGKCEDCGRYLGRHQIHFHAPKAERVRRVWAIGEWNEGFLARGTLDLEVAKAAVVQHIIWLGEYGKDEDVPAVVDRMRAEPGLYRCNPCTCGDNHSFDMGTADQPGPGTFRGVYFTC